MRAAQIPTFKKSLIVAGSAHLALFALLMLRVAFPTHDSKELVINVTQAPIQAVAVSEKELKTEMKRLENIEKQKIEEQLAKERAIEEAKQKLIQEKLAKEKAIKEAQEKLAQEKLAKELAIKKAQEKAMQEKLAKEKAAEQKRLADIKKAQQLASATSAPTTKPTTPAASASTAEPSPEALREIDRYKAMVRQQIMRYWVVQSGLAKQEPTKLFVRVAPTGTVLDVKVVQSSGNEALDRSAIAAVYKASPLPVPQDPDLFRAFRELRLTLRPDSILSEG
jgi:colicin import membrane protein